MSLSKRWEPWVVVGAGLALLFFGPGNYWSATWLSKWYLFIGMSLGVLALWAARATDEQHLPLMLYALFSLLSTCVGFSQASDQVLGLATQKTAFFGLAEACASLAVFAIVSRPIFALGGTMLLPIFWALGVLSTLLLPWDGPHSPPNNGLWFGNPSMGASLLACLLPFVWAYQPGIYLGMAAWVVTLCAIYRTGASVPWGVLGVVTAAWGFSSAYQIWRPRRAWFVGGLATVFLASVLVLVGHRLLGAAFWDQNGRFEIWSMAWDWHRAHSSDVYGTGFGVLQVLLPMEQITTGHEHGGDYFLWLHNDWLQLFIEGGVIGVAFVLLSLQRFLKLAWDTPALFGSIAGFIVLGLFNYPLRAPIHCFCLVLICGMIEASDWPKPASSFRKTETARKTEPKAA